MQWDLTVAAIYHVASRAGVALPVVALDDGDDDIDCPSTSQASSKTLDDGTPLSGMWITFFLVAWLWKRS